MRASCEEYRDIELNTEIMTASKHRQIQMLFDKCFQQIYSAKIFLAENNVSKKLKSVANALDIIGYLRCCLNFTDPKALEMSNLLNSLYAYSEKKLVLGNLKNDPTFFDQALSVLSEIKTGWDGIA